MGSRSGEPPLSNELHAIENVPKGWTWARTEHGLRAYRQDGAPHRWVAHRDQWVRCAGEPLYGTKPLRKYERPTVAPTWDVGRRVKLHSPNGTYHRGSASGAHLTVKNGATGVVVAPLTSSVRVSWDGFGGWVQTEVDPRWLLPA